MSRLLPPLLPSDHLRGDLSAPVQLVEFGDFECPFCGRAYPIVKALEEALGDRLVVGFRNFPIAGSHPHAALAAETAEAASLQGRFWEMHDTLYENQDSLELPNLLEYAARLGLDGRRLQRDLRDPRVREKIRADLHSGAKSGVNGTPSFFINGVRYDGSWDFDSLFLALSEKPGSGLSPT